MTGALLCCLLAGELTAAPGSGAAALVVFTARCAACHGPTVQEPKGQIDYITDLERLAGNPQLIVPGDPDGSRLWQLVQAGEMPPPDSGVRPLTASQVAAIGDWITNLEPLALPAAPVVNPTVLWRSLSWLGKLHLLVLHFPIALAVLAALLEAWRLLTRSPDVRLPVLVTLCSRGAALSAVPVAALGWLHAADGYGSGPELWRHRWLGTLAALWLAATAALVRSGRTSVWQTALILGGALLTAAAAHFGGLMIHGVNFLKW
jgi:mono/diheme cytochrome c family protein